MTALEADYRLCTAENGPQALKEVEKQRPDLVLLDIMMPGMDGYEVCERLKADPQTKDIPVVFLTAVTGVEDKTRGFKLGAVDYITKPFDGAEVKARVRTHLSLKKCGKTFILKMSSLKNR